MRRAGAVQRTTVSAAPLEPVDNPAPWAGALWKTPGSCGAYDPAPGSPKASRRRTLPRNPRVRWPSATARPRGARWPGGPVR
ncbi:hypothetical protein GCM10010236_15040 [Streptomyces eurythermus]|nr:hypothetical protein GCM10010236_15040 [Streptomyces eurythermus]